jgi:hypothetical protein
MRSFRTYANNEGTVDLGAVCRRILAIPDVPDAAHGAFDPDVGEPSTPGLYPLEVVTDGGGEPLRLMGPSCVTFGSPRLVRKLTGAPARSCWRIVLMDEGESYEHVPGLRVVVPVALASLNTLTNGTARQMIVGAADWEGGPFEASGFIVHHYAEALRFHFQTNTETSDEEFDAYVLVWVKGVSVTAKPPVLPGEVDNFGWTLWQRLSLKRDATHSLTAPPHGSRVTMTYQGLSNIRIYPTVDATLRLP